MVYASIEARWIFFTTNPSVTEINHNALLIQTGLSARVGIFFSFSFHRICIRIRIVGFRRKKNHETFLIWKKEIVADLIDVLMMKCGNTLLNCR